MNKEIWSLKARNYLSELKIKSHNSRTRGILMNSLNTIQKI